MVKRRLCSVILAMSLMFTQFDLAANAAEFEKATLEEEYSEESVEIPEEDLVIEEEESLREEDLVEVNDELYAEEMSETEEEEVTVNDSVEIVECEPSKLSLGENAVSAKEIKEQTVVKFIDATGTASSTYSIRKSFIYASFTPTETAFYRFSRHGSAYGAFEENTQTYGLYKERLYREDGER